MEIYLSGVSPSTLSLHWPYCAVPLDKAMKKLTVAGKQKYSADWVRGKIERGYMRLVRVVDGGQQVGFIVERVDESLIRSYFIFFGYSDPGWTKANARKFWSLIKQRARSLGCDVVEYSGRKGWSRDPFGVEHKNLGIISYDMAAEV